MGQIQPRNHQTVIVVKERRRSPFWLLWLWLFGPFYIAWLALKWCSTTGWRLFVAYPWRACIWTTRQTVRAGRWYHARFGWRGWIVLCVVVVALAIVGKAIPCAGN